MPDELLQTGFLNCEFKYQHLFKRVACKLKLFKENGKVKGEVTLYQPIRGFAPGQYMVFYLGDECLGSAKIEQNGPSMFELRKYENEVPANFRIPDEVKL